MENNLIDQLFLEMARIREKLIPAYTEIGHHGGIAVAIMHGELKRTEKAISDGDLTAMIQCCKNLREFTL